MDSSKFNFKRGINTTRSKIKELIDQHQTVNRPIKFQEFVEKNPGKYYKLGGLGPSNIGTEDWFKAKEKRKILTDYVPLVG